MNTPGMSGSERVRNNSWLRKPTMAFRNTHFTANLVGLISGLCVIALLLTLPASDNWIDAWNIRLPLYLIVLVWTVLNPRVTLYLLPIAVPWGSLDSINIGSLSLFSTDILVMFLITGWLLGFTLHTTYRRRIASAASGQGQMFERIPRGPLDRVPLKVPFYLVACMLMLLGVMLLSTVMARNVSDSLKEIAKWLEFLAIFLLGLQYIRTRRQIWLLIVIVCLTGISQAFFGYAQYFLNLGPSAFVRDAGLRVYGTFGQPNPYAGYINIPLSLTLAIALLGGSWKSRLSAAIATIILIIAELLTKSRGGEIALGAAILFIVSLGVRQIRPLFRLGIIGGLAAIEAGLMGLLPEKLFDPVLKILGLTNFSFSAPSSDDFSTAERLAHWIAGISMFVDHPVLGVGIGNYPDYYPDYYITIFTNPLGHAHNYLINIAAETGIIGLTVYVLFLIAIFVTGGRAYKSVHHYYLRIKERQKREYPFEPGSEWITPPAVSKFALLRILRKPTTLIQQCANDQALSIGLLAAFIAITTHNMVDNLYVHSITSLIALLLVCMIRLQEVTLDVGRHGGSL